MAENKLYYGDNLDILRRYIEDESVDLIYLDPPFKSNQDYNILFQERNGSRSAAQIKAFEDTWTWDIGAEEAYRETVEAGGSVSRFMQGVRSFLGETDMMAYLAMMAPRLVELRRVLKPTGSIYLHCDPTASAHLRLLMDAVFGAANFRNELVWKRTHAHGSARRMGPVHDILLFYTATDDYVWTDVRVPHDPDYLSRHFRYREEDTGRAFQAISLTGPGTRRGESGEPWRGVDPTAAGRHWALPGRVLERLGIAATTVQEKLDCLDDAGRIYWPAKQAGTPRLKWYADELEGVALPDVWTDIPPISAQAAERLGYPTQKPEALLERIIKASSNEGDLVLDPFCGCGTAVVVAERLKRKWIGIDITHLAITLIKHRLRDAFPDKVIKDERVIRGVQYDVIGEPVELAGAAALAQQDPFQFQFWALGLVDARPAEEKKGADRGIDGRLYFHDEKDTRKTKQIILQVKAGHTGVKDVRDLRGVIEREDAQIGVLITLQRPTKPMRSEAASAGFYESPWWQKKYPRIQVLTVSEILRGKRIEYPPRTSVTFKQGPKANPNKTHRQTNLHEGQGQGST